MGEATEQQRHSKLMRFGKRYKNDGHVMVESNGLLETLIQCVFLLRCVF